MIQLSLKLNGIEVQKVLCPENAHELSYGMYLDYVFMQSEIADWVLAQMKLKRNFDYQYTTKLAKCIGIVFNIPTETVKQMTYKEMKGMEVLWGRIEKIVQEFTPTEKTGEFTVTYGGNECKYSIPEITQAYFLGTNNLPDLTYQQLEKIGDAEDKLQTGINFIDQMDIDDAEIKGDTINKAIKKAQVTFNNTLRKIALCATPIENIPVDQTFDKWIEGEQKILTKITMHDALNVLFFLNGLPKEYELLIGLNSISTRLNLDSIIPSQARTTKKEDQNWRRLAKQSTKQLAQKVTM